MSEQKVLYKCEDCGCEIVDRGDGHSEMAKPQGLFTECESCDKESIARFEQLGKQAAQRVNDAFMKMLKRK